MIAETNERQTAVTAEEVAARSAVMEIPLFPDLERELIKVFGPNPAIFVHQLVYWFGKPKMQKRRWLYKTFQEWRDERGLGRKSVDTARRRLTKMGVIEQKHGPNKRVHYRVDWIRLAELLKLEVVEVIGDDFDLDDLEESLQPIGDNDSLHPKGDSSDCTLKGTVVNAPLRGQSNTRDYAEDYTEDYFQENSLLQSGAEPAKAEPAPPPINKDLEPEDWFYDLYPEEKTSDATKENIGEDKRHSQDDDTPSKTTAPREELSPDERKDRRFIRAALEDPTPELADALKRYETKQIDLSTLADTMRHKPYLAGSKAWSSLCPEQVGAMLEEMREEVAA